MIWGLWTLTGLAIVYVLGGYPLLVSWLSKRRSRPVRYAPCEPTVTVVMAVHNGGRYLKSKLTYLLALDYPADKLDILVISDGSTDDTDDIVRSEEGTGRIRLLSVPRGGKCAALNAGIPQTRGEILFFTDVRQPLEQDSLRYLVENFADPEVGAVSGELVLIANDGRAEADIGAYWKFEVWLRDSLARIDSMFGATGAIYCLRRSLAVPVPVDILLDDMYLPLKGAFFKGYRLVMERRAKAYDSPMPLETEFRRKVRTLAGNWQLIREMPELVSRQNRMWLHYVSYKLGRLLLPWFLILFLVLTWLLPWPWNVMFGIPQVVIYGMGVAGTWLPSEFWLRKLISPLITFVTMMWASVLAVRVFFVPPRELWSVTHAGKS